MNYLIRFFSFALFLTTAAAFAQPTVVTSIHPIYALTQEIAGDTIEVVRMLPPNVSPHTFDPSPREVAKLEDADLLIMNGVVDEWLIEMADAVNTSAPLVELIEEIEFEPIAGGHHDDHGDEHSDDHDDDHDDEHKEDEHSDEEHDNEHGDEEHHDDEHKDDEHHDEEHDDEHKDDEHDDEHKDDEEHDDEHHDYEHDAHNHGEFNPHLWLDPRLMAQAAPLIAEQLANIDPANADSYRQNADLLASELITLDIELRTILRPVTGAAFVPFHDAWPYFVRSYALDLVVEIEPAPGREPSPAYIAEALELIEGSGAKAIFSEVQLSPRPAEVVAESAGLPLYVLDPIGGGEGRESYSDLLRYNANIILEALQ